MTTETSSLIQEKAPLILAEIQKAKSILLHCHPNPDPDSIGSVLAMKFAVEQLGKKATVIKGDSDIPQAFMHFPGAKEIVMKSIWEIDLNQFDLFIIVDSALTGVSRPKIVTLPSTMTVINIDHHQTNTGSGSINVVDPSYPATGQLLFDILREMKIEITPNIAVNLFMGIYTDTGGFKYRGATAATFEVAAALVRICPDFTRAISDMENSNTLGDMAFSGAALSSIETVCADHVALSIVPYMTIEEKKIPDVSISAGAISSILRTVGTFDIVAALIEARPGNIKVGFRSRDSDVYDVSKLAAAIGGGGHKAAAGATLAMSLSDAKEVVVKKIKELYNL
jgi:bifunctional oligoribonuclease and PAP phosphatase NrnA